AGQWRNPTSQGRKGAGGGNCVDRYSIEGLESDWSYNPVEESSSDSIASDSASLIEETGSGVAKKGISSIWWWVGAALLCALIAFAASRRKK
ncbi:MAG: hypothetical protein K2H18_03415, partial [Muribaculaceae bacterium]|nr:hypothetical protein [Muribaculaceae bacterium]